MLFGSGRERSHSYEWHGLKRGRPRHPFVVLQFTLSGLGEFESPGRRQRLDPGSAFAVVVPGDHVYRLPPESDQWDHFWFITSHAWVVERVRTIGGAGGLVLACDDQALEQAVSLFERACIGRFLDDIEWEMEVLRLIGVLERLARTRRSSETTASGLLEAARQYVLDAMPRSAGVEALATALGMSRSAFSHHFRRETGQTPAAFMTEVRLAEVCRLLRSSREPLKVIAGQTGFADANHLCKVFRRHHGISPGEFRG
jgi:AraC-like DNA-binding protein